MRVLHPEDLGEVIHFDVLCCPPFEFDTWIIVLTTRHVSRRLSHRTSRDPRGQSAEQVELWIGCFQRPSVEGLVESRQTVAANFDTIRSNPGPGADKVHEENDSKESSSSLR